MLSLCFGWVGLIVLLCFSLDCFGFYILFLFFGGFVCYMMVVFSVMLFWVYIGLDFGLSVVWILFAWCDALGCLLFVVCLFRNCMCLFIVLFGVCGCLDLCFLCVLGGLFWLVGRFSLVCFGFYILSLRFWCWFVLCGDCVVARVFCVVIGFRFRVVCCLSFAFDCYGIWLICWLLFLMDMFILFWVVYLRLIWVVYLIDLLFFPWLLGLLLTLCFATWVIVALRFTWWVVVLVCFVCWRRWYHLVGVLVVALHEYASLLALLFLRVLILKFVFGCCIGGWSFLGVLG